MASPASKGSAAASIAASSDALDLKRNSDDMAWEFAVCYNPLDLQRVKCKLCGKEMGGGVTRMKQHIAGIKGQVSSCMLSTPDQHKRCREAYEAPQLRKRQKQQQEEENRAAVTIDVMDVEGNDEDLAGIGSSEDLAGVYVALMMAQILDPIDGTKGFLKGSDTLYVAVAPGLGPCLVGLTSSQQHSMLGRDALLIPVQLSTWHTSASLIAILGI